MIAPITGWSSTFVNFTVKTVENVKHDLFHLKFHFELQQSPRL